MMAGPNTSNITYLKERKMGWHQSACRSVYYKCQSILRELSKMNSIHINMLGSKLDIEIVKQVCDCTRGHEKEEEVYGIVWYTQPTHYHPTEHPATCIEVMMSINTENQLIDHSSSSIVEPTSLLSRHTTNTINRGRIGHGKKTFWLVYLSWNIPGNVRGVSVEVTLRDMILFKIMYDISLNQSASMENMSLKNKDIINVCDSLKEINNISLLELFDKFDQMKECMKAIKKKLQGYNEDKVRVVEQGIDCEKFSGESCKHYKLIKYLEDCCKDFHFCCENTEHPHWKLPEFTGDTQKELILFIKVGITNVFRHGLNVDFVDFLSNLYVGHYDILS